MLIQRDVREDFWEDEVGAEDSVVLAVAGTLHALSFYWHARSEMRTSRVVGASDTCIRSDFTQYYTRAYIM